LGRVTNANSPNPQSETYGYDANNNLTSKTDRKNQTITYLYDDLNRLTSKTYSETTSVDYIYDLVAGEKVGVGRLGWHSFRHSYSTLLNEYGTDIKVQQELLRHADIRTTMNIYTRTVPARLREANSKVVRLLLPTGT